MWCVALWLLQGLTGERGRLRGVRHRLMTAVAVGIVVSLLPVSASAVPLRALVVFGDSLVDTGNTFGVTEGQVPFSPPYEQGRFSNGPPWVEGLAADLGLPVFPFLLGGTNFAFGGSRTPRTTPPELPGLLNQVDSYVARTGATPEALYVLSAGANDLRDCLLAGLECLRLALSVVRTSVDNIVEALRVLADHGATTFMVSDVPNLGRTPESRALGIEPLATVLTVFFNVALQKALDRFEAASDVTIFRLRFFRLLETIIAKPERFGFTNVTDACLTLEMAPFLGNPLDGGRPCDNPDAFLFWDFIHPTRVGHRLAADTARQILFCDATTDGFIDIRDALAVLRFLKAGIPLSGNGDCNEDGVVTLQDVRAILRAR